MALAYPDSHFTGIDLSKRQIDEGNQIVQQLNLTNLQLQHLSITDVTPSLGQFDYILAHGVYSWVPPDVQEKILDICHDNMTDTGVAYISYNTYPGWHTRGAIRDMLLHHTAATEDPAEKIRKAREHLAFLGTFFGKAEVPFQKTLAHEISLLAKMPDTYLLHEYLEAFNEPLYFHQFIARAAAKNLQYLAEAEIASMLPARFGPDTEKALRANAANSLDLEQSMDFLRTRMFRQTLLCHVNDKLDNTLRADAIPTFHIASPMKPESQNSNIQSDTPESFVGLNRPKLTTRSPLLKSALHHLAQRWPLPIPFTDLLPTQDSELRTQDSAELAQALLNCYTAGVVEFNVAPPHFTTTLSDRPLTTPYVRLRAKISDEVTNLRLENIALTEPARLVLSHLDGQHDKPALIQLVEKLLKKYPKPNSEESPHSRATRYLDYILPNFANSALLIR
jgi:methyltransferase-like protein